MHFLMLCPVLFCSIQIISSTNGSGKNPKSIAQTQETTHLGLCTPQFAESQQQEVSPLKHYLNFPFFLLSFPPFYNLLFTLPVLFLSWSLHSEWFSREESGWIHISSGVLLARLKLRVLQLLFSIFQRCIKFWFCLKFVPNSILDIKKLEG